MKKISIITLIMILLICNPAWAILDNYDISSTFIKEAGSIVITKDWKIDKDRSTGITTIKATKTGYLKLITLYYENIGQGSYFKLDNKINLIEAKIITTEDSVYKFTDLKDPVEVPKGAILTYEKKDEKPQIKIKFPKIEEPIEILGQKIDPLDGKVQIDLIIDEESKKLIITGDKYKTNINGFEVLVQHSGRGSSIIDINKNSLSLIGKGSFVDISGVGEVVSIDKSLEVFFDGREISSLSGNYVSVSSDEPKINLINLKGNLKFLNRPFDGKYNKDESEFTWIGNENSEIKILNVIEQNKITSILTPIEGSGSIEKGGGILRIDEGIIKLDLKKSIIGKTNSDLLIKDSKERYIKVTSDGSIYGGLSPDDDIIKGVFKIESVDRILRTIPKREIKEIDFEKEFKKAEIRLEDAERELSIAEKERDWYDLPGGIDRRLYKEALEKYESTKEEYNKLFASYVGTLSQEEIGILRNELEKEYDEILGTIAPPSKDELGVYEVKEQSKLRKTDGLKERIDYLKQREYDLVAEREGFMSKKIKDAYTKSVEQGDLRPLENLEREVFEDKEANFGAVKLIKSAEEEAGKNPIFRYNKINNELSDANAQTELLKIRGDKKSLEKLEFLEKEVKPQLEFRKKIAEEDSSNLKLKELEGKLEKASREEKETLKIELENLEKQQDSLKKEINKIAETEGFVELKEAPISSKIIFKVSDASNFVVETLGEIADERYGGLADVFVAPKTKWVLREEPKKVIINGEERIINYDVVNTPVPMTEALRSGALLTTDLAFLAFGPAIGTLSSSVGVGTSTGIVSRIAGSAFYLFPWIGTSETIEAATTEKTATEAIIDTFKETSVASVVFGSAEWSAGKILQSEPVRRWAIRRTVNKNFNLFKDWTETAERVRTLAKEEGIRIGVTEGTLGIDYGDIVPSTEFEKVLVKFNNLAGEISILNPEEMDFYYRMVRTNNLGRVLSEPTESLIPVKDVKLNIKEFGETPAKEFEIGKSYLIGEEPVVAIGLVGEGEDSIAVLAGKNELFLAESNLPILHEAPAEQPLLLGEGVPKTFLEQMSETQFKVNAEALLGKEISEGIVPSERFSFLLKQGAKPEQVGLIMGGVTPIGEGASEEEINRLIKDLYSGDEEPKRTAIKRLARLKDQRTVEPLIQALEDEEGLVRRGAVEILGELKDPRAVEPLIQTLNDKDSFVREFAARALGNIEDPRAVEPLIKNLKDKDTFVRLTAGEALVRIGEPSVEPLIELLKEGDSNIDIESDVGSLLSRIGEPSVEPLIELLKNENTEILPYIVEALGEIRDPRAVKPLVEIILRDKDISLSREASLALNKIGEPSVEPLIELLKNENARVREFAIWAIGSIKDPRSTESLVKALNDESCNVRANALKALEEIKDPRAVEPLIKNLKDKDYLIARAGIAEVLGEIGDERAVEPLIDALKYEDFNVRMEVVRALGKLEDERAVEPLIKTLKDEDILGVQLLFHDNVRTMIVGSLNKIFKKFYSENSQVVSMLEYYGGFIDYEELNKVKNEKTKKIIKVINEGLYKHFSEEIGISLEEANRFDLRILKANIKENPDIKEIIHKSIEGRDSYSEWLRSLDYNQEVANKLEKFGIDMDMYYGTEQIKYPKIVLGKGGVIEFTEEHQQKMIQESFSGLEQNFRKLLNNEEAILKNPNSLLNNIIKMMKSEGIVLEEESLDGVINKLKENNEEFVNVAEKVYSKWLQQGMFVQGKENDINAIKGDMEQQVNSITALKKGKLYGKEILDPLVFRVSDKFGADILTVGNDAGCCIAMGGTNQIYASKFFKDDAAIFIEIFSGKDRIGLALLFASEINNEPVLAMNTIELPTSIDQKKDLADKINKATIDYIIKFADEAGFKKIVAGAGYGSNYFIETFPKAKLNVQKINAWPDQHYYNNFFSGAKKTGKGFYSAYEGEGEIIWEKE